MSFRTGPILRLAMVAAVALWLSIFVCFVSSVTAGLPPADEPKPAPATPATGKSPAAAPAKVGLLLNDSRAFQGYTLIAPMSSHTTYLIDMQGKVVRKWENDCNPGVSAYLVENGHLLRPGALEQQSFGFGPGAAGRVQEFTWEGELVWDYKYASDKRLPHHDLTRLPNGNVLMIVWEKKTADEAVAAGRRPDLVGKAGLHPDFLIEVKPTGKTTGEIVWEWHLWDHLIQDHDRSRPNFGNVTDHPELVDINFGAGEGPIAPMMATKDGVAKLRSLGYLGGSPTPTAKDSAKSATDDPARLAAKDPAKPAPKDASKGAPNRGRPGDNADWTHFNAVAYNPEFDQIMVSVHSFSEIWVIDHGTTTAEAASHKGGRGGSGGDLLYRWGNPRAWRNGSKTDQRLFNQHNAHWIAPGLPGEGHILVFNNGSGRPGGPFSSVDELALPVDSQGQYVRNGRRPFGPDKPVWSHTAPKKADFYSFFISGAQRLPNGNTLICSGASGMVFEVTPENDVVWKYANPVKGGPGPVGRRPGGVDLFPFFIRDQLKLSSEQRKQVDDFHKELDGKLDKILTAGQKKQMREISPFGPGGFAALPLSGQIISTSALASLKPGPAQKKQLEDLQKEVDARLDQMLSADQKKELKDAREGMARGGPFGFGPPGRPGGPPGGPGGPGGPMMGNTLFRAYRYGALFPGLAGRELKSGKTIEALEADKKAKEPATK